QEGIRPLSVAAMECQRLTRSTGKTPCSQVWYRFKLQIPLTTHLKIEEAISPCSAKKACQGTAAIGCAQARASGRDEGSERGTAAACAACRQHGHIHLVSTGGPRRMR